ncbi:S-adenosyl-L-methionine-dependent methyltransferase [Glonium stellatum]|uniref:S-adenosyl-L-methionine-dependent methyltransferase n=1 Tax=Glonium stellatum TaxID=574774 RepID=A0A8E2ER43_9PEZI|nr:S-adenosyl-L-methionine-dependent methyltransferase [Glonium stellatum]
MAEHQPGKDTYVLSRNHAAASRLNYQFYLWKDTLGFNLHPNIPTPKPDARIADVATGTGIWLLDLAHSLPKSVQLDGFDIDISQSPPAQWLPPNVNIRTWDLFQDVPTDFVGKFDIVHVRLIGLAVKDNNPLQVVSALHKLLKPGGYLQWDEMDDASSSVVFANPTVKTEAIEAMRRYMHTPKGDAKGLHEWRYQLPTYLSQHGFDDVRLHKYQTGLSMARFWNDNYLVLVEEFTANMLVGTEAATEVYQLVSGAANEAQCGAAIVIPQLVVVARKGFD